MLRPNVDPLQEDLLPTGTSGQRLFKALIDTCLRDYLEIGMEKE